MTIKYTIRSWDNKISTVNVIKETDKSFIELVIHEDYRGNKKPIEIRRMKSSTPLFDTWEDAKATIIDRCEKNVESLRMQLERAKGELGNAKGMKQV